MCVYVFQYVRISVNFSHKCEIFKLMLFRFTSLYFYEDYIRGAWNLCFVFLYNSIKLHILKKKNYVNYDYIWVPF
jgi:hypothetical protein